MRTPQSELPGIAAELLARMRELRPCVHCITNSVAQAFTANVLLAVGARPSMTIDPDEIAEFIADADALLVNLGTMDSERQEAIGVALDEAIEESLPWVLDPVFIDRSDPRAAFARILVDSRPRAIRLNAAEFTALAGAVGDPTALAHYALDRLTVLALTGATDLVADGSRIAALANGHPLMAKVTAMGCAASALVTACLAVESDPWIATAAGLMLIGVAGEVAAASAGGPGSLAVGILDTLHHLDAATLVERARVT